jgi:predicted nucleic acid-binding protein
VSPAEAVKLLKRITGLPEHGFWADDIPLERALDPSVLLVGHRQVTDRYLVALAAAHSGTVATLDRGVFTVAPKAGCVELLQ